MMQAMKKSVFPRANVISEDRIFPKAEFVRKSTECSEVWIEQWHLFIWHERKLCALRNAPQVQSTQKG